MASVVDRSTNVQQFRGKQPAADFLPESLVKYIRGEMVDDYEEILQARTAEEVVEAVQEVVSTEKVQISNLSSGPFFVRDSDMGISGATGSAFALVKPGKREAPLRIISAHTDAPCLRIVDQPVYVEMDAVNELGCPGVSLTTEPYGGIRQEDWMGMEVDVVGFRYDGNKTKQVRIPGRIKPMSVHVDEGDKKPWYSLRVDTGYRTLKELYARLGIRSSMEFADFELFAVPHFKKGDNGRIVGNELGAFGQDDRVCVWASVRAGLESLLDSDNTFFIFGLDKEEIYSKGSSAAYRGFFEAVLKETLKIVRGKSARSLDLPLDLQRGLLGNLPAISADVDIGLGQMEMDLTPNAIDFFSTVRSGWGFYIGSYKSNGECREVSPKHVSAMANLYKRNLNSAARPLDRFQIAGRCNTPDSPFASGTMADAFDGIMPIIEVGVPVIGLHNPRSESVNIFDAYWLKQAYATYLRAK